MHSILKRLLVSQSSRVGPDRADRELAYLFKWHNDSVDVRRGIRKRDFMWGRTWSEAKAGALWANIDGPSPGGNQHMPAEVCQEEGLPKVTFCFFVFVYSSFTRDAHARPPGRWSNPVLRASFIFFQAHLWNDGKEFFGHEYFSKLNESNLKECARLAGVEIDLLKKTSAVIGPEEGTALRASAISAHCCWGLFFELQRYSIGLF